MSASERLRAQPPYVESEAGPLIPDPRWPQIVAVVKAAENVTFYGQEAHRYNEWHGSQIVLALAALDKAL